MHVTGELWNCRAERVMTVRSFSYKLQHLFMNARTLTSSHHFRLKIDPQWSWCSWVESCPLSKKSPTSWVMNGGHSSRQMPSWPLGHNCGIVSLKSVIPLMVPTNGLPSWWWQKRQLAWQASLEVCSRSHCCSLEPVFYVPKSMHQIPLLLQTLRVVSVSWQDLCLIHIMLTTTLWGRYYYPLLQSEETEA